MVGFVWSFTFKNEEKGKTWWLVCFLLRERLWAGWAGWPPRRIYWSSFRGTDTHKLAACFCLRELIRFLFAFSLFYGINVSLSLFVFVFLFAGECLFTVGSAGLGRGMWAWLVILHIVFPWISDLLLPYFVLCVFMSWAPTGVEHRPLLPCVLKAEGWSFLCRVSFEVFLLLMAPLPLILLLFVDMFS